jgi:hypothetical protein
MIERALAVGLPTFTSVDVLRTCIDGRKEPGGRREILRAAMRQVTRDRTA